MDTYKYIIEKYKLRISTEYIVEIPNMGRDQLAELFCELNLNKGVEVGTWKGEYAEILCKANPQIELYCVDPYLITAYEDKEQETAVNIPQREMNSIYRMAVRVLQPYNCTIIRETSMNALSHFKDESLDFVYIDANHDFVNFTNDLHYWLKKVRKGGIMSGHDYAYYSYKKFNHVKRALIPYARSYRMIPLFIVGAEEYKEGTIRDKYRSWFWVKQ